MSLFLRTLTLDKADICKLTELESKKFIIKWIDKWKDEIILFKDKKDSIIK
tara:strand:- start:2115 stop:2267 length:153 start_codon:yes stop_codon:yes gene_type:complete